MLFKFRSKACADLIMLEADARRILKAMLGDDPVKGIVLVDDMPQALARLEAAVAQEEAARQAAAEKAERSSTLGTDDEDDAHKLPPIRLAQRAAPMQQMLRRCMAERADLVWGI